MGRIWMPGGGGGADLDAITAGAGDVLAGKVIVDKDGNPLTGTMPNRGAVNQSLAINGSYTIPAGYHNGSGKVTQSIPTQGGSTTTPGTANKTIVAANRYVSGNIVVAGDPNLTGANIKKGKTIFGVTGTFEGYVTSPLYLFNRGKWNGLQTTGLTEINAEGSAYLRATFTDSIGFGARSNFGERVNARFNQKVDLTNYKYLKILAAKDKDNKYMMVGISDSASAGLSSYLASAKLTTDEGYAILDISSITGAKYIYIEAEMSNGYSGSNVIAFCYEVILSNT